MTAKIIDGKACAAKILADIRGKISQKKITPALAVVLVGDNPASKVYINNKKKACAETGIKSVEHLLPATTTELELLTIINGLNRDKDIHGILIQLPLPNHINEQLILNSVDPCKDVDGFHPTNLGKLLAGEAGLRPCTPLGIMELIDSTGCNLKGKRAVVVGRSNIVGKPVAIMLLERHATVTICHSRTENLPEIVQTADILVCAIGKTNFIKGSWLKTDCLVIDVGINRTADGKLTGDVDFNEAVKRAGFITPVPGGVGPMTIAMLMKNTLKAYETNTTI